MFFSLFTTFVCYACSPVPLVPLVLKTPAKHMVSSESKCNQVRTMSSRESQWIPFWKQDSHYSVNRKKLMFLFDNRASLLEANTKILRWPFKMVVGHNLHNMAPFAIPNTGFCMVFQRASFVFSCPGADVWAQERIFGSRVNMLARGPFMGQK